MSLTQVINCSDWYIVCNWLFGSFNYIVKWHGRASSHKKSDMDGYGRPVWRTRPWQITARPKTQLSNFARPNDGWTGLCVRLCGNCRLVHSGRSKDKVTVVFDWDSEDYTPSCSCTGQALLRFNGDVSLCVCLSLRPIMFCYVWKHTQRLVPAALGLVLVVYWDVQIGQWAN